MIRNFRIIPALLLSSEGLVKTVRFKNPSYIGDPINIIKIFNEKEVDELFLLDIDASAKNLEPNYRIIKDLSSEAFFPLAYGGGVRNIDQAKKILRIGVEKIVLSTAAIESPNLIDEISKYAGSSSVVVCIDIKKNLLGNYKVYSRSLSEPKFSDVFDMLKYIEALNAGEIILHSVDHDGTLAGYDIQLIETYASKVKVPIVPLGGAASLDDFSKALAAGASAVSAGSFFVYYGKHRAVLISYPTNEELFKVLPKGFIK
jgi:cyclase